MILRGACHCGQVEVAFETASPVADLPLRACGCSFCRRHGTKAVADPNGRLTISAPPNGLNRYRFGLRTADYLICRNCGVYVAAVTTDGDKPRAIVIVNALDERDRFSREPIPVRYDAETREQRLARRRSAWMSVEIKGI